MIIIKKFLVKVKYLPKIFSDLMILLWNLEQYLRNKVRYDTVVYKYIPRTLLDYPLKLA